MINERTKDIIKGTLGIFIYFFLNIASPSILAKIGINIANLSAKKVIFISMAISILILTILIIISWSKLKSNFKDYGKNYKELLKRNVKYWLIALGIMFVCNILISIIFNRETSANDQTIREIFDVMPVYIIIESMILAPFTEELVFRQSIRYIFKNKYLFIIISGLLFGAMHLSELSTISDFLYIIPYSTSGFFFAYMLYKEDNVLVPISFHAIHNSLALILLVISKLLGVM